MRLPAALAGYEGTRLAAACPCFYLNIRNNFATGSKNSIHHAFLQRNNGVVRDRNTFRTNLRAALRDVAQPDAVLVLQIADAGRRYRADSSPDCAV